MNTCRLTNHQKRYTLLQIAFQHVTNEKERKFLSHGLFYFGSILFCRDTTEAGNSTLIKEIHHNNLKSTEIDTKTTNSKGVDKVINTALDYH